MLLQTGNHRSSWSTLDVLSISGFTVPGLPGPGCNRVRAISSGTNLEPVAVLMDRDALMLLALDDQWKYCVDLTSGVSLLLCRAMW